MCFNQPVSILTFVLGTLLNLYLYTVVRSLPDDRSRLYIPLVIFWQWILFVQFFEAFAWSSSTTAHKFGSVGIFLDVSLQPLLLVALIAPLIENLFIRNLLILSGLIYVGTFFYELQYGDTRKQLSVGQTPTCRHLDYSWWEQLPVSGWLYFIVAILAFVSFPDTRLGLFQLIYLAVGLGLSYLFYRSCLGSLFCFYAAFAPLALLLWVYSNE